MPLTLLVALSNTAIAQLSGTYTVGGTSPDYTSVVAAANDLNSKGISGPVTFNIRPGTYTGRVVINNITGADNNNRITFPIFN